MAGEYDTVEEEYVLIFSDGMEAKLVKPVKDLGEYFLFTVVPFPPLRVVYETEDKIRDGDPRYNKDSDEWELEIKKDWVKQVNLYPKFTRWMAFTNWDCQKFIDPFESDRPIYQNRIDRLKKERDNYLVMTNSVLRANSMNAKNQQRALKEQIAVLAEITQKVGVAGALGKKLGEDNEG
jgi:hypothetical protein